MCTADRRSFFGPVVDGQVQLTETGEIAATCMVELPQHFRFAAVGAFVVMPNHVHALIMLGVRREREVIGRFGPLAKGSLSAVVHAYKSSVTRLAHQAGYANFAWQPRFYDHVVRDERSLSRLRVYIQENPLKWDLDEYRVGKRGVSER